MFRAKLSLVFFFLFISSLNAQQQVGLPTVEVEADLRINIEAIENKAYALLNAEGDSSKAKLNRELKALLSRELNKEEAFRISFTDIKSISVLSPTDSLFTLFNWNIPWDDGTFSYECGILKKDAAPESFYFLEAVAEDFELQKMAENRTWLPGLFYELIETESSLQKYYTLLTWDGNNLLTNKKRIDVIWFGRDGEPRLGAPIFETRTGKQLRVEYEYGGQNRMTLQYNPRLNRIELDHLSPPNNTLLGVYEYYGPDMSFDGYTWEGNRWKLQEIINIEEGLKKTKKDFVVDDDVIKPQQPIYQPNN